MAVRREEGKLEPHPDVGMVFNITKFEKPDQHGCDERCAEIGWKDFLDGDYELHVANGVQHVKIHQHARKNGDAGIARHFEAHPGEVYRLTAVVRIKSQKGEFKCRVNLAPRRLWAEQTGKEGNRSQEEPTRDPVKRDCTQEMHPETQMVTARVKFHTFHPGEAGEGEIYSMKLERLK